MKSLIDSVLQIELRLERCFFTQFSETLWRQESSVDRARTGRVNEMKNIGIELFCHGIFSYRVILNLIMTEGISISKKNQTATIFNSFSAIVIFKKKSFFALRQIFLPTL